MIPSVSERNADISVSPNSVCIHVNISVGSIANSAIASPTPRIPDMTATAVVRAALSPSFFSPFLSSGFSYVICRFVLLFFFFLLVLFVLFFIEHSADFARLVKILVTVPQL